MKTLILTVLLLVSSIAQADKYLILGGFSDHPFSKHEYNEVHPAIGIQYNKIEASYIPSNSIEREGFSLSYLDLKDGKSFDYGYRVGVAYGYKDDSRLAGIQDFIVSGFLPVTQFVISKEVGRITADLGLAPVSTLTFKISL